MNERDAIPWIERLTRTTVFRFLFAMALVVIVPVLLLGVFIGTPMSVMALYWGPTEPGALAIMAMVVTGLAGMIGLLRCRRHSTTSGRAAIELTQVLLVVGIVAALAMATPLAWTILGVDHVNWGLTGSVLFAIGALLVVAIRGLADISRLSSLLRAEYGLQRNTLALLFLGLALGQATVVGIVAGNL